MHECNFRFSAINFCSEFIILIVESLCYSLNQQVTGSDRGVLLTEEKHKEVAEVAQELQKYCVNEPVKCPLIFGGKT